MNKSPTSQPRPKWPWITLLILQALQVVSLLPWLVMAGLAVMAFDAPESVRMWQPWAFVLAIWSYPLWLLLAGTGAWILFVFRRYVWAVALCGLFTLPLPALCLAIAIVNRS